MAEQVSRFKGLRRITQSQEGYRSPSYQVHRLYFTDTIWNAGIHEEIEVEVEATDLRFPLQPAEMKADGLYPHLMLNLSLNDCIDIFILNEFNRAFEIRNFPFYKFKVQMENWPDNVTGTLLLHFYTFTNPRIIEDIKNG